MDSLRRIRMWFIVVAHLAALLASSHAQFTYPIEFIQFTIFLHDNPLDVPKSAFVLIPPQPNAPTNSTFGELIGFDGSITKQADPNSLEIGRGRGTYLFDANDNKGPGIQYLWTAQFNAKSGYGDGTTLSFMGFDRFTDAKRFISIVGGTGKFARANGEAVITTSSPVGSPQVTNVTAKFTYGSYSLFADE